MLKEKEILELLKGALEEYIRRLSWNDLYYAIWEGEIRSYLNVLNRIDLQIKSLDINEAKELLIKVNKILEG